MSNEIIYLITTGGNKVVVTLSENFEDAYEDLWDCLLTGRWFNRVGWNGVTIEYMENMLEQLNCRDIIGIAYC